jgi:hypothetical protein
MKEGGNSCEFLAYQYWELDPGGRDSDFLHATSSTV